MNMNKAQQFWFLYQQTYFKGIDQQQLVDCFAIITASDPLGQIQSVEENDFANSLLQAKLERQGLLYRQILAGNSDFSHAEESVLVCCTLQQALWLGAEFKQNAIFWVTHDELSVVPCLLDEVEQANMGSFIERLR